jgi:peptidyl-prolyl cis-trans isomerase B (cyclophilin B)
MLAKETPREKNCYHNDIKSIPTLNPGESMKVEISTSLGSILLELDAEKAPKTVANFVEYARSGHYEGTIFHRVITDFMIQGGGLDAEMRTKSTRDQIENEADNGLTNEEGTIAMARTPDPHSASSQFFINTSNNAFLNHRNKTDDGWGYCVFGKVVDGMEVVEKIEEVPTTRRSGYQDVPEQLILIERVTVIDE